MVSATLTRVLSMRERVEDTLSEHRNELVSLLSSDSISIGVLTRSNVLWLCLSMYRPYTWGKIPEGKYGKVAENVEREDVCSVYPWTYNEANSRGAMSPKVVEEVWEENNGTVPF